MPYNEPKNNGMNAPPTAKSLYHIPAVMLHRLHKRKIKTLDAGYAKIAQIEKAEFKKPVVFICLNGFYYTLLKEIVIVKV